MPILSSLRSSWLGVRVGSLSSFLSGFLLGMLATATVERYGPATTYDGVVTALAVHRDKRSSGRYDTFVQVSTGENFDLDRPFPGFLHAVLDQGQQIRLALSDVTGAPVAVDVAGTSYDLVTLGTPGFIVPALVAPFTLAIWLLVWRTRLASLLAAAGFLVMMAIVFTGNH